MSEEVVVSWVRSLTLIKRGAESEIRLGTFMGIPAVFKLRVLKPYMHPKLAQILAAQRTRKEAKVIGHAIKNGIPAPRLLAVFPSVGLIIMEYVEGPTLKDLAFKDSKRAVKFSREAGLILAMLHKAGIVHGDPTTSNYIVVGEGGLKLIDYGLSEFSEDVEERAVDIHLYRRAVESTHAGIADAMFKEFLEGYSEVMGPEAGSVIERAEDIRLRGRYVEERRRTVWGQLK
ncbi:MAG: Kae1-associated kinase Bud32 [Thermoprotei archaeon]|nr:Kae1-associated kinase Bud32 [Thermoprotei archaeon]